MEPPHSRDEKLNAGCLLTKKRFSAIFRGFQGVLQFLYRFPSRTAGWAAPGPSRAGWASAEWPLPSICAPSSPAEGGVVYILINI